LYAILFGCSVTIVEVASKTSLVGQLVPEKYQAGGQAATPRLRDVFFHLPFLPERRYSHLKIFWVERNRFEVCFLQYHGIIGINVTNVIPLTY